MTQLLHVSALLVAFTAPTLVQAQTREIRIDAADLAAPDQRADTPAPKKWWLKRDARDWGVPEGAILMTGLPNETKTKTGEWVVPAGLRFVPYRVPALVIDPKARGWHRIFVGLYHNSVDPYVAPRLFGRLSREPYPEYLQAPETTKERYAEVYWKAADLTGQKIHIEQPPAPMPHGDSGFLGGVSHIRLVPLTEADVAAAREEIELPPPNHRLFGMLDSTDEIFWWGTAETEDDIRAIIYRHRESGFGRVYWRAYGSHLDTSLDVPEAAPRWTEAEEQSWIKAQSSKTGWFPYFNLPKKFDPLKVAVEYGQKNDCEVHAWVRFTNHNRPPYSNFWHDHPEFSMQELAREKDPKTGEKVPVQPYQRVPYRRVLSMAYPEVRAYYVKFFQQLASTGTKGILIDLLRHPPIAGYEPIVAEAFKKKHGVDLETRDIYHDPLVNEFFSEYLRAFLVEVRKAIGPDIEISVRSSGPMKYSLSGPKWIEEGLIQTIIDGNWYSGNGPRPTIDETVKAAGARGHAWAVAESSDVDPNANWQRRPGYLLSPEAMLALGKLYSDKGVERFGLYESTVYTWEPEIRRAVRKAGWEYRRQ